jgi:hypothetical protein
MLFLLPLACCLQWRVIFDEGHVLKCSTSIQSRAACSLASDRRWVVTGTPIDMDVTDVYGLLLGLQVRGAKNRGLQAAERMQLCFAGVVEVAAQLLHMLQWHHGCAAALKSCTAREVHTTYTLQQSCLSAE